jgi:hypothetical protein
MKAVFLSLTALLSTVTGTTLYGSDLGDRFPNSSFMYIGKLKKQDQKFFIYNIPAMQYHQTLLRNSAIATTVGYAFTCVTSEILQIISLEADPFLYNLVASAKIISACTIFAGAIGCVHNVYRIFQLKNERPQAE